MTVDATTVSAGDVAWRLSEVRRRIAAAGGGDRHIRIVAVTKGFGPDAVRAAMAAGVRDVGENYADELVAKHSRIPSAGEETDCTSSRWHFLGRVQRNKVKRLAPLVHLWQGVDRTAAGQEIALRAPGAGVLVQVNVSGEPRKNGCELADTPELVDGLRSLDLDVVGLMAVGPAGPPENARRAYRGLVAMADRLELPERSMGMTDDLEVAVEEGTTMVRVGRALFGARSVPTDLRR
jgi:pyridoxal phosphate enzyme (YggS family)